MCGIAGILSFQPAAVDDLRRSIEAMTASLAHRGPDGYGYHVSDDGRAALGHRRLAIIDPDGGAQPLCNEDANVWITYNGELYNFHELRETLEGKGHEFKTRSDTEVVVHAYEQWGDACVERFRGMFAFCVVDFRTGRFLLARDHLGIKPLYYMQTGDSVTFASELQALRAAGPWRADIDVEAMDQYLWLQYIPAPRTIYRQVRKLPPACRLSGSLNGQIGSPEEFWRLDFTPVRRRSEAELLEELDEVLRDSVRAHLVSDVPFGAFLSGGIDSTVIVTYMAELLDRPVRTFTIGFEEADFSELQYAQQVADRWGTEHHHEIVRPNSCDVLSDLVRHYGEPFGDVSAVPTYYVCRSARRSVPMVLSGDGGDEAFAGYGTYCGWMGWLKGLGRPTLRTFLRACARRLLPKRYPSPQPVLSNWLRVVNQVPTERRVGLWRPEYRGGCPAPLEVFAEAFRRAESYPPCTTAQSVDYATYLPNNILTKVDVASMMHGLEVRTPLVDVRVVEFAARIPQDMCIRLNRGGQWEGKLPLKKIINQHFPPEFLHRPKMGFSVPLDRWFAPGGELREMMEDQLLSAGSLLGEYFEPAAIAKLADDKLAECRPLWMLLFLEEWLRQNRAA